jgi:hypothetical protein
MHDAPRLDAIFDKRLKACCGGVFDHAHANSTNAFSVCLRRYHN